MAATSLNEDRPVLIGQVASRTGNNPGGHDNIIGAGLAVEEVNALGGVLGGRPLRILVEDDATRPEHAITAYQKLAESGVCAVVGTSFSNASLAVIPHAERARVPYLSTGAAGSQVEPVRRHVFVVTPPSGIVAEQMARFAVWQGWNTVAVASDTDSRFSREGAAAARRWGQALGLRVLDAGTFRTSTTDFGHIFRAAGAAALFAWATGPPSLAIVRYYLARGIEHPLVLSHGAATPDLLGAVAENQRQIYVAVSLGLVASSLPRSDVRDAAVAMRSRLAVRHRREPSLYVADGYAGVQIIAAAIESAGMTDPADVAEALQHLTVTTPQGRYRFTDKDHSGLRAGDVAIAQPRSPEFQVVPWSARQLTGHLHLG